MFPRNSSIPSPCADCLSSRTAHCRCAAVHYRSSGRLAQEGPALARRRCRDRQSRSGRGRGRRSSLASASPGRRCRSLPATPFRSSPPDSVIRASWTFDDSRQSPRRRGDVRASSIASRSPTASSASRKCSSRGSSSRRALPSSRRMTASTSTSVRSTQVSRFPLRPGGTGRRPGSRHPRSPDRRAPHAHGRLRSGRDALSGGRLVLQYLSRGGADPRHGLPGQPGRQRSGDHRHRAAQPGRARLPTRRPICSGRR